MSIQNPSDYRTGDAVPSGAAMDVNDNAKVFDVFQNAQVPFVKTRLGVDIPTIYGVISSFEQQINSQYIYKNGGNWSNAPAQITEADKLTYWEYPDDSGNGYAVKGSVTLPLAKPASPVNDDNWFLATSVNKTQMRTESASQIGFDYAGERPTSGSQNLTLNDAAWVEEEGCFAIPVKTQFNSESDWNLDKKNWYLTKYGIKKPSTLGFSSLKIATEYAMLTGETLLIEGDVVANENILLTGDFYAHVADDANVVMNGIDYIFTPYSNGVIKITGEGLGKFSATEYVSQRPLVIRNDYNSDHDKYPKTFIVEGWQTFNCGSANVIMDGRITEDVYISHKNIVIKSDSNTDAYIAAAGITGLVNAYVELNSEYSTSLDKDTPRVDNFIYQNNRIDVFMQSGDNEDIAKFSGNLKSGNNIGNYFYNSNLRSAAEVDTFTGGLGGVIGNNHFKNVSLKQMTLKGALAPRVGMGGTSSMSSNVMLFEPNNNNFYGILTRTSFANVSNNIIDYFGYDNVAEQGAFSGLLFGPLDNNENGFGGTNPAALTVNGNVVRVSLSDLHTNTRVHTIDPSQVVGSSFSGNVFIGGNDNVLNPRPENTTNIWSGNQIYSKLFTTEGVWRMQACFTGVGNRISTHCGQDDAQDPMAVKLVPDWAYDTPVLLTLNLDIKTTFPNDGTLFYLHVMSKDGHAPNRQTFIVSSGTHTDEYQGIEAIDNLIDPNTTVDNEKACVFTAGYKGDGFIQIKAKLGYRDGGITPKNVYYMIECISNNFKGVSGI